jgi:putative membrane protein insertion efficiency factor
MSDKLQFVVGRGRLLARANDKLTFVGHHVRPMRVILISLLKFYQAVISPWLPPSCRFVPTCSQYAREAIERHGALRGSVMAVWRLLRCQPFCAGGHDPVK